MNTWHLDHALADRYAAGQLTGAVAASVEAHVTGCSHCQGALAHRVHGPRLAAIWAEVADQVDAPRPRLVARALVRIGVPDGDARLIAYAPALRMAWLLAVCAALAFTVAASSVRPQGALLFLLIAPILPVVGVGLAYGPWTDPTYETSVAAPYSGVRLLLLRAGMVVIATIAATALAGSFVPGRGFAFLWLLPCLALVAATLALAAWIPPLAAAASTCTGWLVLGVGLSLRDEFVTTAFGPAGQIAALIAVVVALTVAAIALRDQAYHAYDTGRTR